MPGAVLLVDLHKAFDSLHWFFIFAMLKSYGFGNSLINWIRILYKNPKCRVVNNNFLSPPFEVKKGVRQGDPLSPTIFLLCIECLAIMLRQSRQYKGIKLNKQTFKVSLFADDIAIFLNGNALQFNYVFDILDIFGQKSGCKVNMSKSNAFYVGSSKGNVSQPFSDKGLSWAQTLVKYMGVNIPITNFDNNLLFSENFPGITREVQTLLNIWSSRGLTLLGKITILKSLVIPKIVYKATYLPVTLPESFIKELNQIMYKFIWGSKWEKVGRSQLCCDVKEGGGKMIDIKQYVLSLRHNFIFKLFDNNYQSSWKSLEHRCIDENVLFCILRSNIKLNSMLIGRVAFLRFTLTTLGTLKHFCNIDNDSKYLWFNKAVKYRNQPMFVEEFCKPGIFYFFQLLKSDFEFYSYDEVASAFHMTPNNTSFIEYIKLISAIPMAWTTTTNSNSHNPSCAFSDLNKLSKNKLLLWAAQVNPLINFCETKLKYYLLNNN